MALCLGLSSCDWFGSDDVDPEIKEKSYLINGGFESADLSGWTIEYGGTETSYYEVECSVKQWTKQKGVWSDKEDHVYTYRCDYGEESEIGMEVDFVGEFVKDWIYECRTQRPIYMVRNKDRFKDNVSVFEAALLPSDLFGGMEIL